MRRVPASAFKLGVFLVVTGLMGAVLMSVVGNIAVIPSRSYSAVFTDALGVHEGDNVRLSGVVVGRVQEVELIDDRSAEVTFEVDEEVPVYREAQLELRWADVVGSRYLAVEQQPGSGEEMPEGATFDVEQTEPALDLSVLFNGFQPLFTALSPDDVNELAHTIIQTLQGEGGTVAGLMRHTAELTQALGDKDEVVGRVVDNLTAVLSTLNEQDTELTDLIDEFRDLMQGLSEDRDTIDESIPAMATMLATTGDLLSDVREPLADDLGHLRAASEQLTADKDMLDDVLREWPGKLSKINRTASYGSWFNFYLCNVDLRLSLLGEAIQLSSPASVQAGERDTVCGKGPR